MRTQLAALTSAACLVLGACATGDPVRQTVAAPPQSQDAYFTAGAARAAAAPSSERARNVILFIGDGMGIATVTAARIYAGQRAGRDGESNNLTMDTFPHTAFSRTYSDDLQISESASTATAISSGVKTRGGGVGLTARAARNACGDVPANTARSIFEIAEEAGLATGVVSTARITHATPASVYAHTPNRDWENDARVARDNGAPCADIARQLIEWPAGDGLEIALGGGRANFLPNTMTDPETPAVKGQRGDGRDLTAEWAARPGHAYVWNSAQLAAIPEGADTRVLGLFSPSHMAYERDRARDAGGEPSLAELTATAIRRVSRDPDGYVLMIEGGRVDHAHHEGRAGEALSETVALDEAIRTALQMTDRKDTLIVVTADHSHTLTISGYARRGTPILGLSTNGEGEGVALGTDGRPYTTLGYANGPGAVPSGARDGVQQRPDLSSVDTTAQDFHQQALVPLASETHGGEDVPLYAWGPGDENFAGTLEQNVIFHLMTRALGLTAR
jgi:alkaline phosphatase